MILPEVWNIVAVWVALSHGSVVDIMDAEIEPGGVISSDRRSKSTYVGYHPSFTA